MGCGASAAGPKDAPRKEGGSETRSAPAPEQQPAKKKVVIVEQPGPKALPASYRNRQTPAPLAADDSADGLPPAPTLTDASDGAAAVDAAPNADSSASSSVRSDPVERLEVAEAQCHPSAVPSTPPAVAASGPYDDVFGPGAVGERAGQLQNRAREVVETYDGVFEALPVRRGWRVVPFDRQAARVPFNAAAEVVVMVREALDFRRGEGMVLRKLDGNATDFFWNWPEARGLQSPEDVAEFGRGLVLATLSDGRGLVEGLTVEDVERYVGPHPLLAAAPAAEPAHPAAEPVASAPPAVAEPEFVGDADVPVAADEPDASSTVVSTLITVASTVAVCLLPDEVSTLIAIAS